MIQPMLRIQKKDRKMLIRVTFVIRDLALRVTYQIMFIIYTKKNDIHAVNVNTKHLHEFWRVGMLIVESNVAGPELFLYRCDAAGIENLCSCGLDCFKGAPLPQSVPGYAGVLAPFAFVTNQ